MEKELNNYPSFSIVINTLNRASYLRETLNSFRWLKYPGEFEVVVVNGPSSDNTSEVLASYASSIRAGSCELANLSVSRNIGICMARGDIVAFIDDDAVPEPEWLLQLVEPYRDPMVGAVGGLVYNHTGYDFQYKYCIVDRLGNEDLAMPGPTPHLSFPKSDKIPHLLGCNSSFRRSVLLEVGGFDEEYEYYLDETDVCLRVVDAGYIIAQLDCAYVHHKYAPSNIRTSRKVLADRFSVVKNKLYFMLKNACEFYSMRNILKQYEGFVENQRNEIRELISENLLPDSAEDNFENDLERAMQVAFKRGFKAPARDALITLEKVKKYHGEFHKFDNLFSKEGKVIVLISKDFSPSHGGGVAAFSKGLAEALAGQGHIVHVVSQSSDISRVDFEAGVWVHRMCLQNIALCYEAEQMGVPKNIWKWSATALKEVKRIAAHRSIDVVEAPIWDCEGIAFLLDGQWPLITSLHTTLYFWLESHQQIANDKAWMRTFGRPMLEVEKYLMRHSHAVRANSCAIYRAIEHAYGFMFSSDALRVVHHGVPKLIDKNANASKEAGDVLTVLFVGRLEYRKGIDVLLQAIPKVLDKCSGVEFRIIGDDSLPVFEDGLTYKDNFLKSGVGPKYKDRVKFEGKVEQETLSEAYENCDIFVAPSRFESFGLVFLEAMREGKPVIGTFEGGMPEIIVNEHTGILVDSGDIDALADAILSLVNSQELRKKMGCAGKARFLEKFTSQHMANNSSSLYNIATRNFEVCHV